MIHLIIYFLLNIDYPWLMSLTTKGVCLLGCKKQIAIKHSTDHILTCADLLRNIREGSNTPGYLIRVQHRYRKNTYWLLLAVPKTSTLKDLDRFLRNIWLECCGHLSKFDIPGANNKSAFVISQLHVGDRFGYDYDFGSTTSLLLHVEENIACPADAKVTCLMRNVDPGIPCENCYVGKTKKADRILATVWYDDMPICDRCHQKYQTRRRAKKARTTGGDECKAGDYKDNNNEENEEDEADEDEEYEYDERLLLPVVNSPRTGECGYTGEKPAFEHDDSVDIMPFF